MIDEFSLIQRYFAGDVAADSSVLLGIGDDAAIVKAGDQLLAVASDTLVEGVHFPKGMSPEHIATRALGVNLSDFAAMGVRPQWYTLAITLPESDPQWLDAFSRSLHRCAKQYGVFLIGGDTTRGALSITLTVIGIVSSSDKCDDTQLPYLSRGGAQVGDDLWVTGSLAKGAAALTLLQKIDGDRQTQGEQQLLPASRDLLQTFYAPKPRIDFGVSIVDVASAAIDISDGLAADARHIATQSSVKLCIDRAMLPVHPAVALEQKSMLLSHWLLAGGDEYELLFTAPPSAAARIVQCAQLTDTPLTKIGRVEAGEGVELNNFFEDGKLYLARELDESDFYGYQHF